MSTSLLPELWREEIFLRCNPMTVHMLALTCQTMRSMAALKWPLPFHRNEVAWAFIDGISLGWIQYTSECLRLWRAVNLFINHGDPTFDRFLRDKVRASSAPLDLLQALHQRTLLQPSSCICLVVALGDQAIYSTWKPFAMAMRLVFPHGRVEAGLIVRTALCSDNDGTMLSFMTHLSKIGVGQYMDSSDIRKILRVPTLRAVLGCAAIRCSAAIGNAIKQLLDDGQPSALADLSLLWRSIDHPLDLKKAVIHHVLTAYPRSLMGSRLRWLEAEPGAWDDVLVFVAYKQHIDHPPMTRCEPGDCWRCRIANAIEKGLFVDPSLDEQIFY